jgi:hypothetical protein
VLLVSLVPNLLAVQRIAVFEENVYMLYVFKIFQDSRVLLGSRSNAISEP